MAEHAERPYTIVVFPDEEVYGVLVPALPGCFSQGRTVDEAIEHANEAVTVHLEGLAAKGEPIPESDWPQVPVAPVHTSVRVPAA